MPVFEDYEYIKEKITKLHCKGDFFSKKQFSECTFLNCSFYEAKFSECLFENCTFIQCDFSLSSFPRCTFLNSTFKESKLLGTDWTTINSSLSSLAFHKCILTHSNFSGLRIYYTDFSESILKETNFSFGDLKGGNFSDTDLTDCIFSQTHLEECDFRSAKYLSIDPTNNFLKKAKFSLTSALGLLDTFEIIIE